MKEMIEAYRKIMKVILSCDKKEQIKTARAILKQFERKFLKTNDSAIYFSSLESELLLKEYQLIGFNK